jgi:signal transduction histidine kinase
LPRRTARLRLTALYGAAFLLCGAGALILIYLLFWSATRPVATSHFHFAMPSANFAGESPAEIAAARLATASAIKEATALALSGALRQIGADRQILLVNSSIALGFTALAATAIGWLLAGRVLRPVSTITAAARRISASNLHERLALRGPDDELKELADTLDGLFARLEDSFDTQRRFAANASHELRTPLTRERTLLQVTLADPAATIDTWKAVGKELLASNAEQEHLIESLLTLASSEAETDEREQVDLAATTIAALSAAQPAVSRLGLQVQTDIQTAVFDGDPLLVQQLAANLIGNAIRHNIPGGDIQISTRTSLAGAVLSVSNSGQVIPDDEVDRLFQPFQRLSRRTGPRDGHGLGLSIVRAIVTAHAADVTARPRQGGGLIIEVIFPSRS